MKNYWLMKSEPETFSIGDLEKDKTTWWEGVRNYQARNFMMNSMQIGDAVLFYHSNASPSGIVGLAEVSALAKPDLLALDPKSEYFDKKATLEKPIWYCVQVQFKKKFKNIISLASLQKYEELKDMLVIKKGQRLSIQPVKASEYSFICQLAENTVEETAVCSH